MRLYISADIEGIVGVVTRDHTSPEGFEYDRARDWMTDTVVAACEAAQEAGATGIVISDSHGNGESLKIDKLPESVQLVRSWPRPLTMMQGIEVGEFAGALLIGYHAGGSNPSGVLAHTLSGGSFQEVRVNGQVLNEAGLNAAIAGHYGVPVIYASGDDVATAEIRDILGDIETTTVKWAYGTRSARTLMPAAAHAAVRAGGEAVDRPHRRGQAVPAEGPPRTRGPLPRPPEGRAPGLSALHHPGRHLHHPLRGGGCHRHVEIPDVPARLKRHGNDSAQRARPCGRARLRS
ncbi:D-aminopeptidase [Inquilinus ginsengisoli]|uniref:M55 family metallopeptidase n=1 Tax=Inquilinus ginsengisoli TaxID=363840 RepID=UPI003D1EB460